MAAGRKRGPLRRLRRATRGPRNAALARAIRGVARVLGAVPLPVALWIGSTLGAGAGLLLGTQRRLALRHLELAFPDWPAARRRAVARGMFRHTGCSFAELAQWPRLRRTGYVVAEGSVLDAALPAGAAWWR
jgi:KDO2-lipid IV(A) lauroyltransferase